MAFRCLIVVAALGVASQTSAQTVQDPQVPPDALRQVSSFESVLASAVTQAAAKVSDRALKAVPEIQLKLEANPVAKGYVMPTGEGMFFTVEVPGIETTLVLLWSRYRELQPPPGVRNAASTSTSIDPTAMITNPPREYSEYTRTAIVDAMLDAITLTLKEGQSLTVSVGSFPDPANPLATGKRLYLTLKADDLIALRANRITRDEARARIIEKRY